MMNKNAHAILIGTDCYLDKALSQLRYAEKDCLDLYEILTDPQIGTFSVKNTTLLLGENATTKAVGRVLYEEVVANRSGDDVVLVFFSGHGVIMESQQISFLGTCDLYISDIASNPNEGLRMGYIHQFIFSASPARQVLFIFDCCHSGGIIPPAIRAPELSKPLDAQTALGLLYGSFTSMVKGRIALVSCPVDAISHEGGEFENGIYTHYLLEGLRGRAAELNGEVTVDSLSVYLKNNIPADQPPGRYGQDFGRFVLTTPGLDLRENRLGTRKIIIEEKEESSIRLSPLRNPLDLCEPLISRIIEYLEDDSSISHLAVESRILESVRLSSEANFVLVLREDSERGWNIRAQSHFDGEDAPQDDYLRRVLSTILSRDLNKTLFSLKHHGLHYSHYDGKEEAEVIVVIPLEYAFPRSFFIICGIPGDSPVLGDAYGVVLQGLYEATKGLTVIHPSRVESMLFDSLKREYGFVSIEAYQARFGLFTARLEKMTVYYQPVVYIHPKHPEIDSWEALARDPETGLVPVDLLKTAELWGDQFKVRLDNHLTRLAITNYIELLDKANIEHICELSVNVYPESLWRSAFHKTLKELIAETILPPEKLVLEISEKVRIPVSKDTDRSKRPIEAFKEMIQDRYTKGLRIGFAIDDFGVGHASVSRLAWLNPAHVKIDQDILQQHSALDTISYVVSIINREGLQAPKIVVEGMEDQSKVTLQQLYKLKVPCVQGYITGKPSKELYKLGKDAKERLRAMFLGEDISSTMLD
jgi:EAL domain-containing protein (putative c-di-GMP-specific phosphodiesterase class I)/uncharacterized caspase-like protein